MKRKLLKKEDFNWNPLYPNNMLENGLEGYYCIINTGNKSARKYTILFQRPIDKNGFVDVSNEIEPELYILFEALYFDVVGDIKAPKAIIKNNNTIDLLNQNYTFNDLSVNSYGSFKRAYKTLEEAKDSAYNSYFHIFGYVLSFIEN